VPERQLLSERLLPTSDEVHIRQHRSFSAKMVAVRNDIKAGILISREDLQSFLNNWLINHILNTDKRLAVFLLASE